MDVCALESVLLLPIDVESLVESVRLLAIKGDQLEVEDSRSLLRKLIKLFCELSRASGHDDRQITRITTKLRDAGRRSPPWKPTSSRVPGRPQDGADGNRINRWLMESEHKFYANEITAHMVEAKYYLQLFSLSNAPRLPACTIQNAFSWLIEHSVEPDKYLDPIQLIPIDFNAIVDNASLVQSGHIVPLDRGGKHEPSNAFLMLQRSNQLQGNLTVAELISLMETITAKHRARATQ